MSNAGYLLLGVWWGAVALAQAVPAEPVVVESSIELPKYTVTDDRPLPKPESWRYAELPGLEILSNASDRNTQQIVGEFRLFEQALGVVWPALQGKSPGPITLLLCGKDSFDSFVPAGADAVGGAQGKASLFFAHGPRSVIVVDLGTAVLNVPAESAALSSAGVLTSGIEIEASEQLKREYVRMLLARLKPRWPAWFEEGLAQLLRGMEVTETRISFAKLEDPNEISIAQSLALEEARQNAEAGIDAQVSAPAEDRGFQAALARSALMGFPEMFAVKRDAALAQNPVGSAWAKQCYAFVHLCLYGEGQRYQQGFLRFITRLAKEEPSEALFKECFGVGYRAMGATLRSYVNAAAYKTMEWNARKGSKGFAGIAPVAWRDATPAEVGRLKGETYALAGHLDRARAELLLAYRRGERDPRLLAALGRFEYANGDASKARPFLEAAVGQNVPQAEAYLALAQMRYAEALAAAGADGAFPAEDVRAITTLLQSAARQPPALVEVFELLADTGRRSPATIGREQCALLVRACVAYPTRLRLVYQTARLCADEGMLKEAHALADHGIQYAPDESGQRRFREFKSTLPPLAPAVTAPAATPAKS